MNQTDRANATGGEYAAIVDGYGRTVEPLPEIGTDGHAHGTEIRAGSGTPDRFTRSRVTGAPDDRAKGEAAKGAARGKKL